MAIELQTLTDGGQPAERTAHALADFVAAAEKTLEIAIYDLHLPPPLDAIVHGAFAAAAERGVAVRLAYNVDHSKRAPVPPPPRTSPDSSRPSPSPPPRSPASPT